MTHTFTNAEEAATLTFHQPAKVDVLIVGGGGGGSSGAGGGGGGGGGRNNNNSYAGGAGGSGDVEGRVRLKAHRRLRPTLPIEIPPDAWRGAYRRHRDGRGYTFEYAIAWMAVGVTPPKVGEVRANTWNIHFSDASGVACTGQIVENVVAKIPRHPLCQQVCNYCFFPQTWGKAVFSNSQ